MKKTYFLAIFVFLISAVSLLRAQVEPAAYVRTRSIDIGATASAFQPNDNVSTIQSTTKTNTTTTNSNQLNANGAGAYVDARLTHRIQLEAEGRWLQSNQPIKQKQTNLLIGPRAQVYRVNSISVYGKILVGASSVQFPASGDKYGYFAIAYGGGLDVHFHPKFTLRLLDFEYTQLLGGVQYPNERLRQYGVSAGVSYRLYGRRY